MTPKEINDLKRQHNTLQSEGRALYAKIISLHAQCTELQRQLQQAEGDEYDSMPLLFGSGFWIDESIS